MTTTYYNCDVKWVEWSVWRGPKHGLTRYENNESGCTVVLSTSGLTATVTTKGGSTFTKRMSTSGFDFFEVGLKKTRRQLPKLLENLKGTVIFTKKGIFLINNFGDSKWRYADLHRLDGPALIRSNGRKEYYFDGRLHRLNGPAVIDPVEGNAFFIDGKIVPEHDYWDNDRVKAVGFMTAA